MLVNQVPAAVDVGFTKLLAWADAGSEAASAELVRLFGGPLERATRFLLRARSMRSKVEVADITQVVWLAFFRISDKAREFPAAKNLARYLRRMAAFQVARLWRDYRRLRRSVQREVALDVFSDGQEAQFADRPSDPAEQAIAQETFEELVAGKSELEREVILLKSQGFTTAEIAALVGKSKRRVRRIIEDARATLWAIMRKNAQ